MIGNLALRHNQLGHGDGFSSRVAIATGVEPPNDVRPHPPEMRNSTAPAPWSRKRVLHSGFSTTGPKQEADESPIATMHLAKGLEFRAVAVMACDDEVIPLQERIQNVGDDADLQEVYETERHLLYVACTRACDHLLVCGVTPVSEFLDDFLVSVDNR